MILLLTENASQVLGKINADIRGEADYIYSLRHQGKPYNEHALVRELSGLMSHQSIGGWVCGWLDSWVTKSVLKFS